MEQVKKIVLNNRNKFCDKHKVCSLKKKIQSKREDSGKAATSIKEYTFSCLLLTFTACALPLMLKRFKIIKI